MSIHFQRDLAHLRKSILSLGAMVEGAISNAVQALLNRDDKLAQEVIEGDARIDRAEIEVEEECLKILALYQPVAIDLRFIVTVLKMNNDLERMGDHSANIAKRARYLYRHEEVEWPVDVEHMAENVKTMVKKSLDALINSNGELARQVCSMDDVVDKQKGEITKIMRENLIKDPDKRQALLKMLDVPRHLERIADLATNLAEDVVYMIEGSIIRHHHAEES